MGNYCINNTQYLQHHGIKGQRWGVRKASRSKRRGSKLVNKYGSKEQAATAINKKAKIKQIAKKSALALMTVGASYIASQELGMLHLNATTLRNNTNNYTNTLRDIININDEKVFKSARDSHFSPEKGRDGKSFDSIERDRIFRDRINFDNSVFKTTVASLTAGTLGGATVATKSSSTSRRDRRKLKDINNA